MYKIIVSICFLFLSIIIQGQVKLIPEMAKFDSLFGNWTNDESPGIAFATLNNGKIEFQKGYGLANVEHNVKVSNNSVFLFPGMSEQMLSFCLLLLEERGKLNLEDEVIKHLDFLPSNFKGIKLRQLLHHSSDLSSVDNLLRIGGWQVGDQRSESKLKNILSNRLSVNSPSKESYQPNKAGLKLLQYVLEKTADMTFQLFVENEIFKPLKMENSYINSTDVIIENLAQGYRKKGDTFHTQNETTNSMICTPLYTTTTDVLAWVDNFWRPKIGSKKIWDRMDKFITENGIPMKAKNRSLFVGQHGYWDYHGLAKYYQIGMTKGYAAKIVRYQEHDLAVVVLGNFGTYNGHLATICSEYYLEPFFTVQSKEVAKPKIISLNKMELSKHVGTYWDYKGETIVEVSLKNDTLNYFNKQYNWNLKMLPMSKSNFYVDSRNPIQISFEEHSSSKALVLKIPGEKPTIFSSIQKKEIQNQNLNAFVGAYFQNDLSVKYEIELKDGKLFFTSKHGIEIPLMPLSKDEFGSTDRTFSRIKFTRNSSNQIISFDLSNRMKKDIPFTKIIIPSKS